MDSNGLKLLELLYYLDKLCSVFILIFIIFFIVIVDKYYEIKPVIKKLKKDVIDNWRSGMDLRYRLDDEIKHIKVHQNSKISNIPMNQYRLNKYRSKKGYL